MSTGADLSRFDVHDFALNVIRWRTPERFFQSASMGIHTFNQ
jgi:hypothetical protein